MASLGRSEFYAAGILIASRCGYSRLDNRDDPSARPVYAWMGGATLALGWGETRGGERGAEVWPSRGGPVLGDAGGSGPSDSRLEGRAPSGRPSLRGSTVARNRIPGSNDCVFLPLARLLHGWHAVALRVLGLKWPSFVARCWHVWSCVLTERWMRRLELDESGDSLFPVGPIRVYSGWEDRRRLESMARCESRWFPAAGSACAAAVVRVRMKRGVCSEWFGDELVVSCFCAE